MITSPSTCRLLASRPDTEDVSDVGVEPADITNPESETADTGGVIATDNVKPEVKTPDLVGLTREDTANPDEAITAFAGMEAFDNNNPDVDSARICRPVITVACTCPQDPASQASSGHVFEAHGGEATGPAGIRSVPTVWPPCRRPLIRYH